MCCRVFSLTTLNTQHTPDFVTFNSIIRFPSQPHVNAVSTNELARCLSSLIFCLEYIFWLSLWGNAWRGLLSTDPRDFTFLVIFYPSLFICILKGPDLSVQAESLSVLTAESRKGRALLCAGLSCYLETLPCTRLTKDQVKTVAEAEVVKASVRISTWA